jgi:hypothetical protein
MELRGGPVEHDDVTVLVHPYIGWPAEELGFGRDKHSAFDDMKL